MPIVVVPAPYRGPTNGVAEIAVAGDSIRVCLDAVEAQSPGFLALVLDEHGVLHRFVKLFLNEVQLDATTALETKLTKSDRVELLAAIAGG